MEQPHSLLCVIIVRVARVSEIPMGNWQLCRDLTPVSNPKNKIQKLTYNPGFVENPSMEFFHNSCTECQGENS